MLRTNSGQIFILIYDWTKHWYNTGTKSKRRRIRWSFSVIFLNTSDGWNIAGSLLHFVLVRNFGGIYPIVALRITLSIRLWFLFIGIFFQIHISKAARTHWTELNLLTYVFNVFEHNFLPSILFLLRLSRLIVDTFSIVKN